MSDWEDSSALDRNELNLGPGHTGNPIALLAPIPSGGEEVSQEA